MLARVADSLYWMSRYFERAENVARFVDVNQNLSLGFAVENHLQWEPLIYASGDERGFQERYSEFDQDSVLRFLMIDEQNPNSMLSCIKSARENARTIRSSISTPTWEEINSCYYWVRDVASSDKSLENPHPFLKRIRRSSQELIGIIETTMTHDEGYHFCRLGRLLERADKTSRILDVKYFLLLPDPSDVGTPMDVVQWSALLESMNALVMYRRHYGKIGSKQVVEFLVLDRQFPRSVAFCIQRAEESLHAITGTAMNFYSNPAEQKLGQLRSHLNFTDIDQLIAQGVHEAVDDLQHRINAIGSALSDQYFTIPTPSDDDSPTGGMTQTQTQS